MRLAHQRFPFTSLALVLATGTAATAGPVTTMQAHQTVRTWLQRVPAPLQSPLAADIASIETHTDAEGRALFHEVRLAPEGFVIVAPDDRLEPVIAFSAHGSLSKDREDHLNLLLRRDLRMRLRRAELPRAAGGGRSLEAAPAEAAAKWRMLTGLGGTPEESSVPSISDVRVAPLVKSRWSQGSYAGSFLYNYFTPNNYVCGCVATAMAQLMRYNQFPTAGIGALSFKVTVDDAERSLLTRGGDGSGGAYDWSQMPVAPTSGITLAQRQMIGSLCYDAGLSVSMNYASGGSGASMWNATKALRTTFKYANALCGSNGGELTGHGLTEMVQPNLDAGFPVLFGITGEENGQPAGHAIVCDGYGYTGATLYHHLNMGWAGSSDAWYNLPDIGTGYNFNLIDDCVYNVFPSGQGEILSGRITDASGLPVQDVLVTAESLTATTNAQGIYALKGLSAGAKTVTAAKPGLSFPQSVRIVGTSQDGPDVGNVWGVDLVQGSGATPTIQPQPLGQDVKLGGSVTFTAGATGIGPLHFLWTKNGAQVGTDAPSYTLNAAAASDDLASIAVRVMGQGSADSAPATLRVVRLFNGDFERGNSGWGLYNSGVVLGAGAYDEVDPHAGGKWLCIGDWSAPCTDFAMQDIELPADGSAGLSLWVGVANKPKTPAAATNVFRVRVLDTSGAQLGQLLSLDNTQAAKDTSGKVVWRSYGPFSLDAWRGRTVRLRIESVQPGGTDTGTIFAVDDVALSITTGPKATLSPSAPLTLVTGGQASFTAAVTGHTSDNHVNWSVSADGGTFSPLQTPGDGVTPTTFTGSATPGTYTVTAMPVETNGVPATTSLTLVALDGVSVGISPSNSAVRLGQSITFAATVSPLSDKAVTWAKTGGDFSSQGASQATWSSAIAGDFTVTATSHGAPGRSASAQVRVVDTSTINLALDRSDATLLPGGSAAFTASGDLGLGVDWSLTTPATHADQGLTTTVTVPAITPITTATYTLRAAHKLDASRAASATITVKGMDLVRDGAVDLLDLLGLAAEWGRGATSPANFKGTGVVDEEDLAALLDQLK